MPGCRILARWTRRNAVRLREGHRRELPQRPLIDAALEKHDIIYRIPIFNPTPAIELRSIAGIKLECTFIAAQLEHEPHLFLADAQRLLVMPLQTFRQAITQPATGRPADLNIAWMQPGFLMQFAIHGIKRGLIRLDAPLRKLPDIAATAPRPENAVVGVQQNDADVGPEAVNINHLAHQKGKTAGSYSSTPGVTAANQPACSRRYGLIRLRCPSPP